MVAPRGDALLGRGLAGGTLWAEWATCLLRAAVAQALNRGERCWPCMVAPHMAPSTQRLSWCYVAAASQCPALPSAGTFFPCPAMVHTGCGASTQETPEVALGFMLRPPSVLLLSSKVLTTQFQWAAGGMGPGVALHVPWLRTEQQRGLLSGSIWDVVMAMHRPGPLSAGCCPPHHHYHHDA
jgi:hypothetical protein